MSPRGLPSALTSSDTTYFERLGGQAPLRAIIADFVDRMMKDAMIGFFFASVDRDRLIEMEYQFTAEFLGAPVSYAGRPIRQAHAKHPIMGGQFDRRKQLLRETLKDHDVPEDIRDPWLAHVEGLRHLVTRDPAGACD